MFKRNFALLLVVVLLMASFAGCSSKPAEPTDTSGDSQDTKVPQIFTYNMGSDPETLDPNKASENVGMTILANTCEGLVRMDDAYNPLPGVAEKWEVSDDGLEYTFYLRDAKWSDGKPITAEDFAYSWERALNPDTAADYAYQLFYIKNATKYYSGEASADELGIEVIDEKTIKVTLEGPTPWMMQIFAFPTMFPVRKDIVEANPDTWALEASTFVCNGPFKVAEWKHNEVVTLVPNENYWDAGRIKLEKVNVTLINEESTALAAFEAGDIDAADSIPNTEIPRLQAEMPDEFMILPQLGIYYYTLNNRVKPLDDERVRRALSYAIDRKAIVETVTLGGQLPATAFVPYGVGAGGEDFREVGKKYFPEDGSKIEEAKQLLAEAGYPNGEGFPKLTVSYNTHENHKRIAEAIQQMWKKNLNIDVELTNTEWAVHLKNLEEGNYQIGRIGWLGDYAHPMTFLDLFIKGSGNNYSGWNSDEFDELIAKAKVETDMAKANEYMHKAEDIFMDRVTVMPIYFYTDPEVIKSYVKGWRKSPLGWFYFDGITIEK